MTNLQSIDTKKIEDNDIDNEIESYRRKYTNSPLKKFRKSETANVKQTLLSLNNNNSLKEFSQASKEEEVSIYSQTEIEMVKIKVQEKISKIIEEYLIF